VVLTKGSLLIPPLIKNNDSIVFSNDFDKIIDELELNSKIETIFVIGGENVYKQALQHPKCEKIYLNMVQVECDLSGADAFFPNPDPTKYGLVETTIIDPTVTSYVYERL
jgi:dihydrofolate reductase